MREQLEQLRGLGCRFGQGYYWSKPLYPEQAFEWMIGRPERLTA